MNRRTAPRPKISSIQPDFKHEGYLAARAIDRMPKERTIRVGVKQVVHRESTYPMSNSGKLVQKALAYIEKVSSDCGWDNVNSLKNLFHKATGKSMREWRASPT